MTEKCLVCNKILSTDQFIFGDDDGRRGEIEDIDDLCESHTKEILKEMLDV